jgi:hypothetical protein
MRTLIKKFVMIVPLLVLTIQGVVLLDPPKASAAFDANTVVSDAVFENINSINAGQIDNFLNAMGGSCIRSQSGFVSPDPLGYSGGGYQFGGNVTAGQAIYDISRHYNINPQVLLTTLQKEQSIPTGGKGCHYDRPNPDDPAQVFICDLYSNGRNYRCTDACPTSYGGGCMNIAMGYGCPRYCNVDVERFHFQISGASWMLRFAEKRAYGILNGYAGFDAGDEYYTYSGPMTPGYRQRVTGGANAYYDGTWTTKDGVSVTITNGATASLYSYTPFTNGNRSFQTIFESTFGFGSTVSGNCLGSEPVLPYVQRYYNPRTFMHFYSAYACDANFLRSIGYTLEGPVFNTTPCTAPYATPVYRYYNPSTGLHFWNTVNESQPQLDAGGSGYRVEAGTVFCVATGGMSGVTSIHRLYNARTFMHIWAVDPTPSDLNLIGNIAGYSQSDGPVFYTQ